MIRGLVIGKFCPLHEGHQFLIESALAQVDELHIWSWSVPEFPEYPPSLREYWLRTLYPDARVRVITAESVQQWGVAGQLPDNSASDSMQQEFVAVAWQHCIGDPLHLVFTSEAYGDSFAATLTRRLQQTSAVRHVIIDQARRHFPISGGALRARWQPHAVAEIVASTATRRVVFLGAESTGKTTLSTWAAQAIGGVVIPEYGRTLWMERRGRLTRDDMLLIARTQIWLEDDAAHPWAFCDTSPLTTLFYSEILFGSADDELRTLSRREYDLTFLCAPDFPLVQDGTRQNAAFRVAQHAWYRRVLAERRIAFIELTGDLSQRQHSIRTHFHEIPFVRHLGRTDVFSAGAGPGGTAAV